MNRNRRPPAVSHPALSLVAAATVLAGSLLLATPAVANAEEAAGDPLEPVNRVIFKVNDAIDVWLFEPIAKGWDLLLPDPAIRAVDRFFDNLRFPIVFANSVLQGKPVAASDAFGRFMINTLLGAGGFLDVATSAGLERVDEDFGQTLGYWGLGPGPYLVLPILGPSSVRDGIGLAADGTASIWPYFVPSEAIWSAAAVNAVNTRALLVETVSMAKRDSLDYYAAVRDAYLQHREALVEDRRSSVHEADDDLYYPDVDEDEDLYFPDLE